MSVSLKAMVEDLDSLIQDLKESEAPLRQVKLGIAAHEAVVELLYCLKQDCPYCFKARKQRRRMR